MQGVRKEDVAQVGLGTLGLVLPQVRHKVVAYGAAEVGVADGQKKV